VCMSGLAQESVGLLESIPHITLSPLLEVEGPPRGASELQ